LQFFSFDNIEGEKTQPSMPLYFPQWILNIFILLDALGAKGFKKTKKTKII
jgi:hypothetical protein